MHQLRFWLFFQTSYILFSNAQGNLNIARDALKSEETRGFVLALIPIVNLISLPFTIPAVDAASDLVNKSMESRDNAQAQVKELQSEIFKVNDQFLFANTKVYLEKQNVQNAKAKMEAAQVVNKTLADIVAKVAVSCSHAHVLDNLGKVA